MRGRFGGFLDAAPDQVDLARRVEQVPGLEVERAERFDSLSEPWRELEPADDCAEVHREARRRDVDRAVERQRRGLAVGTVVDHAADRGDLDAVLSVFAVDEHRAAETRGRQRQLGELERPVLDVDPHVVAEGLRALVTPGRDVHGERAVESEGVDRVADLLAEHRHGSAHLFVELEAIGGHVEERRWTAVDGRRPREASVDPDRLAVSRALELHNHAVRADVDEAGHLIDATGEAAPCGGGSERAKLDADTRILDRAAGAHVDPQRGRAGRGVVVVDGGELGVQLCERGADLG